MVFLVAFYIFTTLKVIIMKLFKSLKICLAVIFLTTPLFSLAQYKFEIKPFFSYFRDLRRWEIGGTYMVTNGTFDGVIPTYGYNNLYIGDKTLKRNITSTNGYGGTVGLTVPFAATGHISCWAMSIHALFNYYKWDDLNRAYNSDGTFKELPNVMNSTTMQIAMPIGIDWKVGCDAFMTKRLTFGLDFGAGIMPHVNFSSIDTANKAFAPQQSVGLFPYANADFSIAAGFCAKIRVMYTMGNAELVNSTNTIGNTGLRPFTDGPFRITANNHLMVSLILMPFSRRWHESNWANDYDTYNWNERIN